VSSSASSGTLYEASLGGAVDEHDWPYVPEDLHYSKFSDNLWCLTELPNKRAVFAVKKSAILVGCD
jgi:hypothetical protein